MSTITNERAIAIGELSRRTGVNIETIRYYERIGMMPRPLRSQGGRRLYTQDQSRRLAFIKRARTLGFMLEEIRTLLALTSGAGACAEVKHVTEQHLEEVRQRIKDLRRLEKVLRDLVAQCDSGRMSPCPVLESLSA